MQNDLILQWWAVDKTRMMVFEYYSAARKYTLVLFMILGRKAAPLAHLVKKNRRAADLHDDSRAPSWALHDLG